MNLRQEVRKANLAKWKKQGPAVIKSPLKLIHQEFPDERSPTGEFIRLSPIYATAFRAAQRGDGNCVKTMARGLT